MSRDDGPVIEVTEVPTESRYVISVDGQRAGFLDYALDGGDFIALHTEVDPAFRGQGLAEQLVRAVLERVEAAGERLRVRCPYVREFLVRHPTYADLTRARSGAGGAQPADEAHEPDELEG